MSTKYTSQIPGRKSLTPQTEKASPDQVVNNAGGFSFSQDEMARVKRFLILGSEGGTYYVSERKLTQANAANLISAIKKNGTEVVKLITEISVSGRAPKNDPAIFALALACTHGDEATKTAAYSAISKVCRTGTHLFQFTESIQDLRGWSRGLRTGVGKFYTERSPGSLATQLVKYRQRNGWTHRDVLRLSHVKPATSMQAALLRWAVGKPVEGDLHPTISAFEEIQALGTTDVKRTLKLVADNQLPWEVLPTELLGDRRVWEGQLAQGMPLTAMIRNLGKMTSLGILDGMSSEVKKVVETLGSMEALHAARVHPLSILIALSTYKSGHGFKGSLSWKPNSLVVDALDEAFYKAFEVVVPAGKNYFLGLDVSGSMGDTFGDSPLSCCEAATAMALVTHRTEPWTFVGAFNDGISEIPLSKKSTLSSAMKYTRGVNFGGTDCALPMKYALERKMEVDTFVVYTDNETWAGVGHPHEWLRKYRSEMSRPNTKLVVVGMTSNGFTIADPSDKGMLDIAGFDTTTPAVISQFSAE